MQGSDQSFAFGFRGGSRAFLQGIRKPVMTPGVRHMTAHCLNIIADTSMFFYECYITVNRDHVWRRVTALKPLKYIRAYYQYDNDDNNYNNNNNNNNHYTSPVRRLGVHLDHLKIARSVYTFVMLMPLMRRTSHVWRRASATKTLSTWWATMTRSRRRVSVA
jgi:hypothetical protein